MKKQSEQQNIDWFNKIRLNSWEVEILIVGFVLVIMLQIPEHLEYMVDKVKLSNPQNTIYEISSWLGKVSALLVIKLCINILIISFTIYLGLRGFWVGLIGFSSVYPDGINIKKLNYNKIFSEELEKINFNNYIVKIDNTCSMIFSISFFFSFSIMSLLIFCIQVLIIISSLAFLSEQYVYLETPLFVILLTHLLFGIIWFLDFYSVSYLKKIKWKPFGIFYNYIDKFFTYTTLIFIYKPLYYAIVSNIKQRVLFGVSIILIFCYGIGNFFNSNVGLIYFPYEKSENHMKNIYYENKFEDLDNNYVLPYGPFINVDIITDGYLKLYMPYYAKSNSIYEQNCKNIENIYHEWATLEKEQIVLDCINELYNVTIDDESIESDFIFYHYSKLGVEMRTFFMPIETSNIDNGKHLIKITENFSRDREHKLGESVTIMEIERDGKTYTIPFYVFKD